MLCQFLIPFSISITSGYIQSKWFCSSIFYFIARIIRWLKMNGSVLKEISSFKMLGLSLTSSLSLTPLPKKGSFHSMRFLSCQVALYFYKSSIQFNMEYCCLAWVIVLSCYLVMLNKQQKPVCWTTLFAALEPVVLCQIVASLKFFSISIW